MGKTYVTGRSKLCCDLAEALGFPLDTHSPTRIVLTMDGEDAVRVDYSGLVHAENLPGFTKVLKSYDLFLVDRDGAGEECLTGQSTPA